MTSVFSKAIALLALGSVLFAMPGCIVGAAIGGMAEIFLAHQRGMGGFEKEVVVKRLLPEHAQNEELVGMFLGDAGSRVVECAVHARGSGTADNIAFRDHRLEREPVVDIALDHIAVPLQRG